jgi:guanylate kinase
LYLWHRPLYRTRLAARGTETGESLGLKRADQELDAAKVPGFHDRIIVNDDLERAYQEFIDYIFHGNSSQRIHQSRA